MANPLLNDNTGILGGAVLQGNADRAQSIYSCRVLSLNSQIENFKKLLAECEAKHGKQSLHQHSCFEEDDQWNI
jgi:hypothetical protein